MGPPLVDATGGVAAPTQPAYRRPDREGGGAFAITNDLSGTGFIEPEHGGVGGNPAPSQVDPAGESRDGLGGSEGSGAASLTDRQVVRKATVELKTPDVRAVFLKAAQLTSEAGGEFVESSSLSGTDREAQASLTLRVAADRLDKVLNELSALGTVASEQSTGEDVTVRVVDLEARLANERRFEAELLELLDARLDSPLRDVLEMRRQIGAVRQSIEFLEAQRQKIARLVELATVLVIIRHEDPPPQPTREGASPGRYFLTRIEGAWRAGVRFLADTLGWCLRAAVGGLVWWVGLMAVAILARSWWRSARAQRLAAPA
jgi:hypothetical protein